MSLIIRAAAPDDLERVLAPLDREFVFGKGRRISLARRFPTVYCADNAENIFLAEQENEVLSALACKRLNLQCAGRRRRGAMIGTVYTVPQRRGEGLASRLLERAAASLRDAGCEFAVLWTAKPAFYAHLGWLAADHGVLGEFNNDTQPDTPMRHVTREPAHACDSAHIERIRGRWCECLTPRRADDYRQLPLPAEAVDLLLWRNGTAQAAFALVGNANDGLGIVYELIGDADGFAALWSEAGRGYRRVLVNDVRGSPSQRWLARHTDLAWQEKPLAMWLPLAADLDMAQLVQWHIPYFDRI